jgi:hypothetical protein
MRGSFPDVWATPHRYIHLSENLLVSDLLDLAHHAIAKWGQIFVWVKRNEVLGVGAVHRLVPWRNSRWILSNFAVNDNALTIEGFLKMRVLLRRTISYARGQNASELFALVRSGNGVPYVVVRKEGFQERAEHSYHWLSLETIEGFHDRTRAPTCFQVSTVKPLSPTLQVLRNPLALYKMRAFQLAVGTRILGRVEIARRRGSKAPLHLELIPNEGLHTMEALFLIAKAFHIASHSKQDAVVLLPTGSTCLRQALESKIGPALESQRVLVLELKNRERLGA